MLWSVLLYCNENFEMPHNKPYHRTYRPVNENLINSGYSDWAYIIDQSYAQNPEHYVRGFLIIQNDIFKLFEYIEPSDENFKTHSFRIHELLMRICMEIEANFKSILRENIYNPKDKDGKSRPEKSWNFEDYSLVNKTHHLDEYKAKFPVWKGVKSSFQPYECLKRKKVVPVWWTAYNKSKHDRYNNFEYANFENLLNAFAGLFILLTSQFGTLDFKPGRRYIEENGYCYYGGGFGIGDYMLVDLPENWDEDEMYDFDWKQIEKEEVKFERFDYNAII